ncbi:MAG: trypsin-like peptidase domain-containing protein [Opitutaceae bacterium]|jgi:S1-C subfamily serine protease
MHPPSWNPRALAGLLLTAATILLSPAGRAATDTPAPPKPADSAKPSSPASQNDAVENSVVKIFSTVRRPDLFRPWDKEAPHEISGSGVVIEGKRILTNAHVVLYASQIQVQANQAGDKISATVEAVAPGIDLAVLKLDDESFFDSHPALPRAPVLPQIKDAVLVYGYPEGGTNLSITKGIVSRIEFVPYNFHVFGLRVQIDAAINPGNSGGPALVGDKMVGLAFSHLAEAENIGYIIPCEEIELFLKDIADGRYDGKPAMFDEVQTIENPALRSFLRLNPSVKGVMVNEPFGTDSAYPLKKWDVITRIGDTPVDDQGMVKVGHDLRVRFDYLVQKIAQGGKVPLTVVRAGQTLSVELPVSPDRPMLVPYLRDNYPSYFIYGPLVFSIATQGMVSDLNAVERGSWSNLASLQGNPLLTRRGEKPAFEGEELVIIPSSPFPHKLAKGYGNPITKVVKSVNGIAIKNLDHLVEVLRDSKDKFITIEFAGHSNESLVFPRAEMAAATDDILGDNDIRSQGSPDTLAVWNAKKADAAPVSGH